MVVFFVFAVPMTAFRPSPLQPLLGLSVSVYVLTWAFIVLFSTPWFVEDARTQSATFQLVGLLIPGMVAIRWRIRQVLWSPGSGQDLWRDVSGFSRSLFGGALVVLGCSTGLSHFMELVSPAGPWHQAQAESMRGLGRPIDFIIQILLLGLLPAVAEELVFRQVVWAELKAKYGRFGAWVGSSVLFSLLHLTLPRLLPTFIFGLVLAAVRQRVAGLLVPMWMHLVNNVLVLTLVFYGGGANHLVDWRVGVPLGVVGWLSIPEKN